MAEASTPTTQAPRLIPLTKWPDHHQYPPIGGLRHLVFHARQNGFDRVIKRVGRRILIDEAAYFRWVEAQNAGGGEPHARA